MSLDVFQRDELASIEFARQHMAQDLPATFSESFDAAWRAGLDFGNSDARGRARIEGTQEFVDRIRQQTGVTLVNPALGGGAAALDEMNRQIAQLAPKHPQLGLKPLTEADIDEFGIARSRESREAFQRMSEREQTFGSVAGSALGNVAAGGADPVNIITVPLAAPAALGIVGTALATGGITAGTQLGIEALTADYKEKVEPGYATSGEAGQNVVGAAVAGAVLGGGAKALGALWTRVQTGAWPRSVRDAGNVVASEAQIAGTNILPGVEGEVAHRTALQASIDALVSGRPVDIEETVTPALLRGYEARLAPVLEARAKAFAADETGLAIEREGARLPGTVERLTEQQLADIRATARSIDAEFAGAHNLLDAEGASLTAQRTALADRTPAIDSLRDEVDGLRSDLEQMRVRIAEARPPIDPTTQARLDAVDTDLRAEALPAERRAELEAERSSITDTLDATGPGDARLSASLRAEEKGLRRALARKEKALDRSVASEARARAKIDRSEAALPARRIAAETRAAGRREAAATEMRKAISRLAQDGYGLRLPRDDAEAFASRILGAGDEEIDAALREITETLVDRRLEVQRAAPAEQPGIGRSAPVAEQEARRGYWTDETRKRVQALAREVGYEMPRDEADAVAAAIARAPDEDAAGAILDEVMLRPRTIAATLPGTEAARLAVGSPIDGAAAQATARLVRDDVADRLRAVGLPEDEVRANATIFAARYQARAVRLGLGPKAAYDLYRREGIDIRRGPTPEALGERQLAQFPAPTEPADQATIKGLRRKLGDDLDTILSDNVDELVKVVEHDLAGKTDEERTLSGAAAFWRNLDWVDKLDTGSERGTFFDAFDHFKDQPFADANMAEQIGRPLADLLEKHRSTIEPLARKFEGHEEWGEPFDKAVPAARRNTFTALEHALTSKGLVDYSDLAGPIYEDLAARIDPEVMTTRESFREVAGPELTKAVDGEDWEGAAESLKEYFEGRAQGEAGDWDDALSDILQDRNAARELGPNLAGAIEGHADLPQRLMAIEDQQLGSKLYRGWRYVLDEMSYSAENARRGIPASDFVHEMVDLLSRPKSFDELDADIGKPLADLVRVHADELAGLEQRFIEPGNISGEWLDPVEGEDYLLRLLQLRERDPATAHELAPNLLDELGLENPALLQSGAGAPRGAITLANNRAVIDLFQQRDASTFMHEASHLWLTELARDAGRSDVIKGDLDTVLGWFGVDDASKIGRQHQEQWARGFEQYLRDGTAPTSALGAAFAQFREWLTTIYRAITDLGSPLPNDIRGVMDRMLSADLPAPARTAARGPRPEQLAALAPELTPAKIAAARSAPEVDDVVANDLDKLRAMGDRQVPIGERMNERGELEADMRSVDDLLDEADARLAAAKEIAACALPQPEAA